MKSVIYLLATAMTLSAQHASGWRQHAADDVHAVSRVNPYEGRDDAARAGAKLYERYCASCHGVNAEGKRRIPPLRPAAKSTPAGELDWLLKNGSLKRGMPSWSQLPPEQRWQIVTFLKTLT